MNAVIEWKLDDLMWQRRMTNVELAEKLGVKPNSVSRLKKHKKMPRIDHDTLDKLCEILECDLTDLLVRKTA